MRGVDTLVEIFVLAVQSGIRIVSGTETPTIAAMVLVWRGSVVVSVTIGSGEASTIAVVSTSLDRRPLMRSRAYSLIAN